MALDPAFLEILRCPLSGQSFREATAAEIQQLNADLASGARGRKDGAETGEPITEALVTEDGATYYAVREGIPVLLPGEAFITREGTRTPTDCSTRS